MSSDDEAAAPMLRPRGGATAASQAERFQAEAALSEKERWAALLGEDVEDLSDADVDDVERLGDHSAAIAEAKERRRAEKEAAKAARAQEAATRKAAKAAEAAQKKATAAAAAKAGGGAHSLIGVDLLDK